MKELRRNMRFIGVALIALFLFVGGWFGYTARTQGSRWLVSGYNTRLSRAKRTVVMGSITDRDGYTLAYTDADGARHYASDRVVRLALSQTVGDTMSMSGTGVQTFHAGTLVGMSGSIIDRTWQWLSGETTRGDDIQLTVDASLCRAIAQNWPSGYDGAAVVLNYKTGEILAMLSMPEYDPANLGASVANTAYFNRCLQGQYTPGSAFKIVTLASALDNLHDPLARQFFCEGGALFGDGQVTCLSGTVAHGSLNMRQAFAQSCNVSFASMACDLGAGALQRTAESFGFNDDFTFSDIVLYASSYPRDIGSEYELAWTGVGQGRLLVTPMHMAMIAGAVANNGVMMEPKLIATVSGSTGLKRFRISSGAYRRVMSEDTATIVGDYMRTCVESGTGTRAKIRGYTVCGKTGSAEVSDNKTVATNAWFVGYLAEPEHPYAVAIVLEKAGSGGNLAATLAAKALSEAIDLVG